MRFYTYKIKFFRNGIVDEKLQKKSVFQNGKVFKIEKAVKSMKKFFFLISF